MSFFDRFRSAHGRGDKDAKQPKHTTSKQEQDEAAKKVAFRSVPGAAKSGSAEKKAGAETPKKQKKQDTGQSFRTLLRPVVTEKSTRLAAMQKYVFEVSPVTNKVEVRRAILALYGVRPLKVNMLNFSGKAVRYGRTSGRTKAWKKAIVTLPAGQKIDYLES